MQSYFNDAIKIILEKSLKEEKVYRPAKSILNEEVV